MKRINWLLITIMLAITINVFPITSVEATNLNSSYFTTDDAINLAISNSIQCKIDDLNIEIKQEELKQANENAQFLGDVYGAQKILNNKIIKEVRPFEAMTNVELAKRAKQDNIKSLKVNITKSVQRLLIAEIEQAIENKKLDIMLEKYSLLQSKLKQNLITEHDMADIEFSIENKKSDIVNVGEKIESIKNDIKKLLGLPFSDELMKIDEDIEFELIKNIDENNAVLDALKSNTSIYRLSQDLEAKQKNFELNGLYLIESNLSYISSKYGLEQAKAALADMELNIEVDIKNNYANLLNQRDRVYLAEKYLSLAIKKLNMAEVKYKNGVIATDALLNAKEAVVNAEFQKYNAIYSYNLIKIDFEAKIK